MDEQTEIYIYIYKGLQLKTECTPTRGGWTDWNIYIYIYKGLQPKTECTPPRGGWTDWKAGTRLHLENTVSI